MYTFILSGQGTNILQDKPLLSPLTEGAFHAAAATQLSAARELTLGILLILLGLGIYVFWNVRNRDSGTRRLKHSKMTTLVRTSSRWFWID